MKKLLSVILCAALLIGAVVIPVSAAETAEESIAASTEYVEVGAQGKMHYTRIGDKTARFDYYDVDLETAMNLKTITIPATTGDGFTVTSIAYGAFDLFFSLKTINLPDTLTNIPQHLFENTAYYENSSNWDNGILYVSNHLIEAKSWVSKAEIREGVVSIAESAFKKSKGLTEVTLPDSLKSINYGAFKGCSKLEKIELPDGIRILGSEVFRDCTSLKNVRIPDTVVKSAGYLFCGCTSLENVEWSSGATVIHREAFSWL